MSITIASSVIPAGSIFVFPLISPPSGFLTCDGSAVSRTTYTNLYNSLCVLPGFASVTFTVTIASPAVVTAAGHGFTGGERLRFSTTGALPTGLNTSTDYFVQYIDSSTFNLSLTPNGSLINTSGTQSGTHSYLRSLWGLGNGSTTFNVPDLRGVHLRNSGISSVLSNAAGSAFDGSFVSKHLNDKVQEHWHSLFARQNAGGGPLGGFVNASMDNTIRDYSDAVFVRTAITDGTHGTPRTGYETAPASVSLLSCIKY